MKKITFLFTFLIAFGYSTHAQVSAYSFAESTEAYAQITGTTSTATGDDGSQNTVAIGFTFNYEGTDFTTFSINTNGWIRLGNTITTGSFTNSLANASTYRPLIAPFWDDNNMTGGEIRYAVTGTFPNQVLTVNWHNSKIGGSGSTAGATVSTLLRLYETTNVIEFVYSNPYTTTNTVTASVGLNGASSFLSVTPAVSSTVSSAVANNAINATVMANLAGKKLIFNPPMPCTGTPAAGTATPAMQTLLVGQASAALVATGYSSGVSGLTYQWQESPDDATWVNAVGGTGATTASYTPPVFASTIYYRLVVTCTPSAMSANTPSVLLTGCSTVTAFVQNFDGVTTPAFPGCWGKVGALGTANTQTANSNSAPNTLYMYATGTTTRPVVAMQSVSNLGAGTHRLRFNMRANVTVGGIIEFGYLTNQADATTFVALGTATAAAFTYAEYIITPTAGSYSNFPAFRHTGAPANSLLIDDVRWELIPACLAPTTLSAANITATSADLSWVDGSGGSQFDYEYVVQAAGTGMPASGTPFDISSLPAPSGVLTANTPYEFWVRADCGGSGYSTWAGPFNFTTACNATNVPYLMDFESATIPAMPSCTSVINAGTGNVWNTVSAPGSGFTSKTLRYPWNGSNAANTWFFTQGVNLTAGTSYRISYDYGNNSTTYTESLSVAYGSSASAVGMTNAIASHPTINTAVLQNNIVDFIPTTTGVYYFGFQATSITNQFDLYVDNINVILTPSCSNPIGLTVSNLTDVSADISWTATTGSYEYVLDGLAADPSGSGTPFSSETYNATGLTPSTTYYFHVRTVCGGPSYSAWSTIMFTTLATPPVNDNLCNAIPLTLGAATTGSDYTMIGSTSETSEPIGTCFNGGLNGSVWFSFVAPTSGSVEVTTDFAGGTLEDGDTEIAVYDATGVTCSDLSTLPAETGCDQDSGTSNVAWGSFLSLTGLTPSATYYIQVDRYGTAANGTFGIQVNTVLSANSYDSNSFIAYPNPVKDVLNLEYNSEISSVRVINLLGQEVISKTINATSTKVDMSQLNSGAYIVSVTIGDTVKTIKVVKQ